MANVHRTLLEYVFVVYTVASLQAASERCVETVNNVTVVIGSNVSLSCQTDSWSAGVRWTYRSPLSLQLTTIYNGIKLNTQYSHRYNVVVTSSGYSRLIIYNVHFNDTGTLLCSPKQRNSTLYFCQLQVVGKLTSDDLVTAAPADRQGVNGNKEYWYYVLMALMTAIVCCMLVAVAVVCTRRHNATSDESAAAAATSDEDVSVTAVQRRLPLPPKVVRMSALYTKTRKRSDKQAVSVVSCGDHYEDIEVAVDKQQQQSNSPIASVSTSVPSEQVDGRGAGRGLLDSIDASLMITNTDTTF